MGDFVLALFDFLAEHGYLGIAVGLMLEVIPSEIVLSYGGYLVSINEIHFFGATIAGVIGGTMAQIFLYWLGRFGGRPVLDKYGKFVFISAKQIDLAESLFQKHGTGIIFSARFIPVVRHAISIPAGIAKMPLYQFTVYTVAAVIPWTILFLLLGIELGEHWRHIKEYAKPVLYSIIIIALFVIFGYIIFIIYKNKKEG